MGDWRRLALWRGKPRSRGVGPLLLLTLGSGWLVESLGISRRVPEAGTLVTAGRRNPISGGSSKQTF